VSGSGFKVELEGTQYSAISDSNGYFIINDVAPNSAGYTVKISKPGFLARRVTTKIQIDFYSIIISSPNNPIDGFIRGDLNNDEAINIGDVIEIAKYFGKTSADASYNHALDLTDDGVINMSDVIKLAMNFGRTSADYPPIYVPIIP
jgi:hypothetical protein